MKRIITFLMLSFLAHFLFAQPPVGYYDGTSGLTGTPLKNKLYNIIKGHRVYQYSADTTDIWDILKEADRDPNAPSNVILIYTGWSVDAEQEYNKGKGWEREHIWSQSHGEFGRETGAGSDAHHLRPVDGTVNRKKSNRDFDEGGSEVYSKGIFTNCYFHEFSFEPRDEVKGDIARMIFYMAVRYEGKDEFKYDLELSDELPTRKEAKYGRLSTLIKWHLQDPVDSTEVRRNNIIYHYQKNRNPFIDHPEWVTMIWD